MKKILYIHAFLRKLVQGITFLIFRTSYLGTILNNSVGNFDPSVTTTYSGANFIHTSYR